MAWKTQLLTNEAYGYPSRGDLRRIDPIALVCLHVTANPSTPPATAQQERDYANRADSDGPSAHTYAERTGGGIHAIDTKFAAWSNGAVRSPKTSVPGVQAVLNLRAKGYNANEAYYREIEICGRYPSYPITEAQLQDVATLVALDSIRTGLPIQRSTVHLHSDIDSELRPNCPVPAAGAEAWVTDFIARANRAKSNMMNIDELLAELARQIDALKAERDTAIVDRDKAVAARDALQVKIDNAKAALQ
jgi:hypothetical protein